MRVPLSCGQTFVMQDRFEAVYTLRDTSHTKPASSRVNSIGGD